MFPEDLFEGWLSVPSMEGFFELRPQSAPKGASNSIIEPPIQQDLGLDLMHPAGTGPNSQSYGSDSVGADYGRSPLPTAPQTPNDAAVANPANRKRRGHTKSRLGCISCKKRKIKCQETWPSCANCVRRGCPCRYPVVFKHTQHDRVVSELLSSPRQFVRLSDTPKSLKYSADDMRIFHHFLIAAHPCIPHDYAEVWVRDIPTLSHQYEYLMHGILAMAGSHLDILVDNLRGDKSLVHRQKAIEGLEQAFTRWPPTSDEAHVMLATSYLLAFQSSYMSDGMLDHVLCLRGTAMMSQTILEMNLVGAFPINPNMYSEWFEWKLANFPSLDQQLARNALRSLANFAPHLAPLESWRVERALLANLVECVRPLLLPLEQSHASKSPSRDIPHTPGLLPAQDGIAMLTLNNASSATQLKNPLLPLGVEMQFEDIKSWDAITEVPPGQQPDPHRHFNALMSGLLILNTWPREDVLEFMSPTNVLGNIVMAHFFCVRFIVAPLSAPGLAMNMPVKAMVEWCEKVIDAVEDDDEVKWSAYVEWPQKITTTIRCYLNQKRGLTFGDLLNALVNDPATFREGRLTKLPA